MHGPFDTNATDFALQTEDSADESFDEGDQGDGFSDELSSGDSSDAFEGDSAADADLGADLGDDADDMSVWNAFEEEVADGLDAADEDEFLGRLIGGLGRAAGVVGRGIGRAAGAAGQVGTFAGGGARAAQQVGEAAGAVTPAAAAAARLARMLGAPGVARSVDQLGRLAQGVRGAAGQAGSLAGSLGQAASGAQGLLGQLSQLIGGGGNEFDDFEAMADLYVEDGVDEALPAAVALAARAAARGLGFRNVAQLTQAGRRALVRGVAAAARELVRGRGPSAVRALPRLARSAGRVATRSVPTPQAAAQAVRRGLPQTARRVAQSPRALRRLEQPVAARRRAPAARDPRLGRGMPTRRITGPRTFYIDGPVMLTVTPR
jgi:hypothetical protein